MRLLRSAALLCVGLAALVGCGAYEVRTEPRHSGFLRSYEGMRPNRHFRQMAVRPGVDTRSMTRVRLVVIEVAESAGVPWVSAVDEGHDDLSRLVADVRAAFHEVLAASFEVLPDDSRVDDKTFVVRMSLTRLTVVDMPDEDGVTKRSYFSFSPVGAAMELAVWKGLESTPIVRVKDWRHGRLKLRRPFDAPDSEYGDMLTIFRSWAERLRGALVDLSAKSSAPASR